MKLKTTFVRSSGRLAIGIFYIRYYDLTRAYHTLGISFLHKQLTINWQTLL